jgi:hypothetical protein
MIFKVPFLHFENTYLYSLFYSLLMHLLKIILNSGFQMLFSFFKDDYSGCSCLKDDSYENPL